MNPEHEKLLRELAALNPDLASDPQKLERLLTGLTALKPKAEIDPAFRDALRVRLLAAHERRFHANRPRHWHPWISPALIAALLLFVITPVALLLAPRAKGGAQELAMADAIADRRQTAVDERHGDTEAAPKAGVDRSGKGDSDHSAGRSPAPQATLASSSSSSASGRKAKAPGPEGGPDGAISLNLIASLDPVILASANRGASDDSALQEKRERVSEAEADRAPRSKKAASGMEAPMGAAAPAAPARPLAKSEAKEDRIALPARRENSGATENPFVPAARGGRLRLPAAAGRTSFDEVRRELSAGRMPMRAMVRHEEILNHYRYRFPATQSDEPVGIHLELLACPWAPAHLLALIAIEGRPVETTSSPAGRESIVATAVSVELSFNAERVESHRLLGYENPSATGTGVRAVGELRAGEGLVIAFELIPPASGAGAPALPHFSGTLHYTRSGEASARSIPFTGPQHATALENAPAASRFAAAVIEWSLLLANSPHRGAARWDEVLRLARLAYPRGADPLSADFEGLVRRSASLDGGKIVPR